MDLDFQIDMAPWVEAMAGAGQRVANMRPAHRAIGELLEDMTRQNIQAGGGNEPWPPLALSTLINRARDPSGRGKVSRGVFTKKGTFKAAADRAIMGAKPLIWSGKLLRSIRYDAQNEYCDVGTPMIKGRTLFFGGKGWHGSRVPARYPFRFRVGDVERISAIYVNHIFDGLKK